MSVGFCLDGREVRVEDDALSLLDALREHLGVRTAKDGCSPQGQCGCCTVWVDGAARISCVTPVRRVEGRTVTTTQGLPDALATAWAHAFVDAGASQCGFCTPGIVMRLCGLETRRGASLDEAAVRRALAAHLCRCTGWQTIVEAAGAVLGVPVGPTPRGPLPMPTAGRDPLLVAWRAQLEGPAYQSSTPETVLGHTGFADDTAPAGATVAFGTPEGSFAFGSDLPTARRASGKVQGRNSPAPLRHPIEVPEGDWALVLRTTWVEPAYLEPDASWCAPGGIPATPLANGGAFGAKRRSPVVEDARRLAAERNETVRVVWSREDVVRRGPKRPPVALALGADATGVLRVARTPGSTGLDAYVARVAALAPDVDVELVDVAGPPVSADIRGAGWAEVAVGRAALGATAGEPVEVRAPGGGRAAVSIAADGHVDVDVWAGTVLDPVVLRSYCIGAVHQALGWVRSEGIAVDEEGTVHDLTVRSYGVLTARDTPWVEVTMHDEDRFPVNGSDAVFAATAAAAWLADGLGAHWPTRRAGGPAGGGRP